MSPWKGFTHAIPEEEVRDILEGLIACAPFAVMLLDAKGNVIAINQAHTDLTGLTFDRLVHDLKMNFRDYLKKVNPMAASEIERAFKGEYVELTDFYYQVPKEIALTEKLAKGFWLNSRAFPIKDPDGNVRYVVLINEDITAKKELESILLQTQKMESVGLLAGGIAHDFNNILAGIMGYASLLAAALKPGTEEHDAAMTILDVADRAAALTNHLLTIARKSVPSVTSVKLQELLPRTIKFVERSIGPKYRVELQMADDLYPVDADRAQLEQVVVNLCINARDAMPKGGLMVVRATNVSFEPGKTLLPTMPAGDYVELAVIDHGAGIPPDVLDRVFEPFFTTKELGRGSGLGLAVVYGIVKSHRGFVVAQSKVGVGSQFTVYLPKGKLGAEEKVESKEALIAPEKVALNVLVVEDDPMVRRVLCDMLARLGHRFEATSEVQGALNLLVADSARFDLLLVDVIMPERDGFDLVEAVRAMNLEVPIVLCTGMNSPETVARAQRHRRVRVLAKPFDLSVLNNTMLNAYFSN